jgi:hypothetical protein
MITAAAVTIRPVRSRPEDHREQEDRDPPFDLRELVEAEQLLADPEAKDDDEHAVARRNGEQVENDCLQRQDQGPEGTHEQQVREREHGEDEPRERAVGAGEEVHALRGPAAGEDVGARRESGSRYELRSQPPGEALSLLGPVLVPRGDDHLTCAYRPLGSTNRPPSE